MKRSASSIIAELSTTDMRKIDRIIDTHKERNREFCDGVMITAYEFEEEWTEYEARFLADMDKRFNAGNYEMTDAQFGTMYNIGHKYYNKQALAQFNERQSKFRRS